LLAEALESVRAQTVGDWECVVVDDGSEQAPAIGEDSRIRLVRSEKSRGPGAARNLGLYHARGKYVVFLDDDDALTAQRLEIGLESIDGATFAICGLQLFDGTAGAATRRYAGDMADTLVCGEVPHLGQVLLRRADALSFNEELRTTEDFEWWLRMAGIGCFRSSERVGYLLRRHQQRRPDVDRRTSYRCRVRVLDMHREWFDHHPAAASRQWQRIAAAALLADERAAARRAAIRALTPQSWREGFDFLTLKILWRSILPFGGSSTATQPLGAAPALGRREEPSSPCPQASVVIPALNASRTIAETLSGLAEQTIAKQLEVLVCDNGSTDGTEAAVRSAEVGELTVRLIDGGSGGPSIARNTGIRAARSDLLLFCDADDYPDSRWAERLCEHLRSVDVVVGSLEPSRLNTRTGAETRSYQSEAPTHWDYPFAFGANCGYRREVFEAAGLWDARYRTGQDIEMSWRAQLAGFRLGWCPDAVVHYRHRAGLAALVQQFYRYGRKEPALREQFHAAVERGAGPRTPRPLRLLPWVLSRLPYLALTGRRRALWLRRAAFMLGDVGATSRLKGARRRNRAGATLGQDSSARAAQQRARRGWRGCAELTLARSPAQHIARRHQRPCLRLLAYHGIRDPRRFAAQLDYLAESGPVLSLAAVIDVAYGRAELSCPASLITFDDGDPSVADTALPLLLARRLPAVAFVVANLVDAERASWWVEAEALAVAGGTLGGRWRPPRDVIRLLKLMADDERLSALDELRSTAQSPAPPQRQLRSDELRTLEAGDVAVGSHSATHPCLDRCTDAKIRDEVTRSRARLTDVLGHPPLAFAYPNGDEDPRVRSAVRSAGYQAAFLFDHRLTRTPVGDPLTLSRLRIDDTASVDRLAIVVSGLHSALHRLRRRP
jgi:glycosyltransferase involved in cell wall biosynthesis/peptidoglycan/xylan/chitin deacetylase (PgdA/CDA1 family)